MRVWRAPRPASRLATVATSAPGRETSEASGRIVHSFFKVLSTLGEHFRSPGAPSRSRMRLNHGCLAEPHRRGPPGARGARARCAHTLARVYRSGCAWQLLSLTRPPTGGATQQRTYRGASQFPGCGSRREAQELTIVHLLPAAYGLMVKTCLLLAEITADRCSPEQLLTGPSSSFLRSAVASQTFLNIVRSCRPFTSPRSRSGGGGGAPAASQQHRQHRQHAAPAHQHHRSDRSSVVRSAGASAPPARRTASQVVRVRRRARAFAPPSLRIAVLCASAANECAGAAKPRAPPPAPTAPRVRGFKRRFAGAARARRGGDRWVRRSKAVLCAIISASRRALTAAAGTAALKKRTVKAPANSWPSSLPEVRGRPGAFSQTLHMY